MEVNKPMFRKEPDNRAGAAAALTIAWALVMGWAENRYPFPHVFHHDISRPVLALELSTDGPEIDTVLHRAEKDKTSAVDTMRLVNILDLVFIPIYSFFLWSVARVFTSHTRLLTLIIAGVALFDYAEDWQINQALQGASPAICVPSLVKWGLLGLALLATAVILLRSASPVYSEATKKLLAIAYAASGGLTILSVVFGRVIGYSLITLAMQVFSLLVVVHLIAMLGRYLSIPGITQKYVENFCEERKRAGKESLIAVRPERGE
jgi:hypothetical protein